MKQQYSHKLSISKLWLVFLPFILLTHTMKYFFYVFLILSIHESAHMLIAYIFHYTFHKVIVYPFGLSAQFEHMGHGNVWNEICILIAGPCMHFFIPFLLYFIMKCNFISYSFFCYLLKINRTIFLFNLLPIYPLDGGRIMQSFFHLVFRYQNAQMFTYVFSIVHIGIVFGLNVLQGMSGGIVLIFLLIQIFQNWYMRKEDWMQFLYYRKKHPCNAKLRYNHTLDLYRGFCNLMHINNCWMLESEYLNGLFASRE